MSSTPETWAAVDEYLDARYVGPDEALDAALAASDAAGLPTIQVTPTQGKLLYLLARMIGARRVLEVGTLGGYSAIWLARALPAGGQVVTLEIDPRHAEVAKQNITRAGLETVVDVRVGPALETLPLLAAENVAPFDLVFIDADKQSNPDYVQWALRLTRTGSVMVVDNVIRSGGVLDAASSDASIAGTREVHELLAGDPRLDATAVQTVGTKGYDGFAVAVVTVAG